MQSADTSDPYASASWLPPEELVDEVLSIKPLWPQEKRSVWRETAGLKLDRLLTQLARGRGAAEIAIGELLVELCQGQRLMRLGFSNVGDYGRERLNISPRSTQLLVKLARDLRTRPLLRAALRRGIVSRRKAQTIASVAHGSAEADWVSLATTETVRSLVERVRAVRGADASEDEIFTQLRVRFTAEESRIVTEALELADRVIGPGASMVQRVEAICQEYLSDYPGALEIDDVLSEEHKKQRVLAARVRRELEEDHHRWRVLGTPEPWPAPAVQAVSDPFELDQRLTRLAAVLARWDELLGHAAFAMRDLGLWRDTGFASFAHYCSERLGLGVSTVNQRIALHRDLYRFPQLREAMQNGCVGYEQARFIVRVAKPTDIEEWIERAQEISCLDLQRQVMAVEEEQMCARDNVAGRFSVPRSTRNLILAAMAVVRSREGRSLRRGACMRKMAERFYRSLVDQPSPSTEDAQPQDSRTRRVPLHGAWMQPFRRSRSPHRVPFSWRQR